MKVSFLFRIETIKTISSTDWIWANNKQRGRIYREFGRSHLVIGSSMVQSNTCFFNLLHLFVWGFSFNSYEDNDLWSVANFDLDSALMALEHWGLFGVPHLLWLGTSVYNGHLREPLTLAPVQWCCHYLFIDVDVCCGRDSCPNLRHAINRSATRYDIKRN